MMRGRCSARGCARSSCIVVLTVGRWRPSSPPGGAPSSASTWRAASPSRSSPSRTPRRALDQAIEVIRPRVDALGVAEPEITRQGDTIVVQPARRDRPGTGPRAGRADRRAALPSRPRGPPGIHRGPPGRRTTTAEDGTTTTAADETSTTTPARRRAPSRRGREQARPSPAAATPFQDETTTDGPGRHDDHRHRPTRRPPPPVSRGPSGFELTPREDDEAEEPVTLRGVRRRRRGRVHLPARPRRGHRRDPGRRHAQLDQTGQWAVSLEIKRGGRHRRRSTPTPPPRASAASPPARPASSPSSSTAGSSRRPRSSTPSFERRPDLDHRQLHRERGQGPGPRAAVRLAARGPRDPADPGGLGHPRQRLARAGIVSPASSASPSSPST